MTDGVPSPTPPTTPATLMQRAEARQKSYVGPTLLVIVLSLLLWLPGLIANVLFLLDARRQGRIAQQTLPGTGCLRVMLVGQILLGIGVFALVYYALKAGVLPP